MPAFCSQSPVPAAFIDFCAPICYILRMKDTVKSGAVLTALFAALICAGCFIQIPIPGLIPIVIQDMLAMLSGLILGPLYGTAAVLIFLLLGSIGLPVFRGVGGLAVITQGPTGGFLIGYLLGALAAGLIAGTKENVSWLRIALAAVASMAVIFAAGALRYAMLFPGESVWALAIAPFIPGTIIKLIAGIPIAKKFRTVIARYRS